MRSTLDLEDRLFRAAKARAAARGETLTSFVEGALREEGKSGMPFRVRSPAERGRANRRMEAVATMGLRIWELGAYDSWHELIVDSGALQARTVRVSEDELTVDLADGRRIPAPLVWIPSLLAATPEERQRWQLLGDREGIRWPSLAEHLSVAGLLIGAQSPALRRAA